VSRTPGALQGVRPRLRDASKIAEPPLNERQKWIVAEYLAGRRPSNKDIQKASGCSRATTARDLRMLKQLGLIKAF